MTKKCITQVNIPTVDNESIECDYIIGSKCVIIEKYCKKVGNVEGETLAKFIEKLCSKLAIMDNKIYILTQEVKRLKLDIPEELKPDQIEK